MRTLKNQKKNASFYQLGFTITELLVVIAVLGILAAVAVVGYNSLQKQTTRSAVMNDIKKLTDEIVLEHIRNKELPESIEHLRNGIPDATFTYGKIASPGGLDSYSGLTPPQNGKLFYDICVELNASGMGRGANDFGGGYSDYISGCYVYGKNHAHVNGWNGGFAFQGSKFPVTQAVVQEYAIKPASTRPSHPNYQSTVLTFMNTLSTRFLAQGGTYPITEFWNPWEGVPTLPAPTASTESSTDFCLIASSTKYTDISFVTSSLDPTPRQGEACS